MEQFVVLANGKCRRKFSPEHAIFAAGNALRTTKFYVDAGAELSEQEEEREQQTDVFVCRLLNCNGVGFRSARAYEEHYDLLHRNVCHACFRPFLSARLLDIHVSESHDAFFRVLSKQKPMYVCLVDGCVYVFKHDDKRTRHLVQDHGYPATFSFHTQRRRAKTTRLADATVKDVDATKIAKAQARKAKRKEKKRQLRAEATMASDQATSTTSTTSIEVCAGDQEAADAEMEDLASTANLEEQLVARMAQLQFVPKSISFGRRQQRRR